MVYIPWEEINYNLQSKYEEEIGETVYFTVKSEAKCKEANKPYVKPLHYTIDKAKKDEYTFKTDVKGKFTGLSYNNFFNIKYDDLKTIWKWDNNLFEIVKTNERKLYFDLDYIYISEEHNKNVLLKLFSLLNEILDIVIKDEDIYISYGKGLKKDTQYASYHIIINNDYKFKNLVQLQSLIRIINKLIYFKEDYNCLIDCLDIIPYTKNQAFKIPFQTKPWGFIKQDVINKKYELKHFLISHTKDQTKFYDIDKVILKYGDIQYKNPIKNIISRDNEIIKVFLDEEIILNNYNNCFDENFELDINIIEINKDDKLKYFIGSIPNNNKVSYDIFFFVGSCIKTIEELEKRNDGLNIYFEWVKGYNENIKLEDLKIQYDKYKIKYGYGYKKLFKIARIFNKTVEDYNEINYLFNFKPPKRVKEIINIDNKYIGLGIKDKNLNLNNLLDNNDIIYIKSPMGSGKTYAIKEYIKSIELKRMETGNKKRLKVLIVCLNIAFTNCMYKDFKGEFTNYTHLEDKKLIKESNKLLCSIESLKYVKNCYDIVIFDEMASLISNITSNTNLGNNPTENLIKLNNIVSCSKKIISMDAFLFQSSYNLFSNILKDKLHDKKEIFINNCYKAKERQCIIKQGKRENVWDCFLKQEIIKKLSNGFKCVLCLGSQSLLHNLLKDIETYDKDENKYKLTKKQIEILKDTRIKYYDKDNQLSGDTEINNEWVNFDLLIYTPTITAGISFDKIHFDYLFLYLANTKSALVRNMIQAHKRVRNFKKSLLYIAINTGFKNHNYSVMPRTIQEVKNLYDDNKNNIIKGLFNMENKQEKENWNLTKNMSISAKENNNLSFYMPIFYYNTLERILNDLEPIKMWEKYLSLENIKIIIEEDEEYEKIKEILEPKLNMKYEDIDKITKEQYDIIIYKTKQDKKVLISELEKNQRIKYIYDNTYINKDISNELKKDFYNLHYKNQIDYYKQTAIIKIIKTCLINEFKIKLIKKELNKFNVPYIEMLKSDKLGFNYLVYLLFETNIIDVKNKKFDFNKLVSEKELSKSYNKIFQYEEYDKDKKKISKRPFNIKELNLLLKDERIQNKNNNTIKLSKSDEKIRDFNNKKTVINNIFKDKLNMYFKSYRIMKQGKRECYYKLTSNIKELKGSKDIDTYNPFNIYDLSTYVELEQSKITKYDF